MYRAAVLLLITLLVLAGQSASACPQGHCAKARTMACCQHDGLSRPSCCPPFQRVLHAAPAMAVERPVDAVMHLTSNPLALHLRPSAVVPLPPVCTAAPPGTTLVSQHTSLLL